MTPNQSLNNIFGNLVQLWDSYCDEKSSLEEYPDIDSFLRHNKVAPSKQAIKDLFLSIVGEDEAKPTSHANKVTLDMEWRSRQIRNNWRAELRKKIEQL